MRIAISTLVLGIFLIGCGSSAPTASVSSSTSTSPSTVRSAVYVPPGVDSSAARYADSVASESFVSLDKQEQAAQRAQRARDLISNSDTLWRYLEMASDTTRADSISQERRNAAIRAYNRGANSLKKYAQVTRTSELDSMKVVQMQRDLLSSAQEALEKAISLNPYDDPTRSRLAEVYALRARRLGDQQAYEKSIEILEKLTRLRKDQPGLHNALANNYYETEQYGEAAENYRKARETYIESVELSLDGGANLDSNRAYQYIVAEADAHVYDRDAAQAIERYELAQQYATSAEQETFAQGEIKWVNWDDGNIDAAFARDSLASLASQGEFAAAADGFRDLKSQLQTQSARNEIDWRLAQAEYQNGAKDQAAERLQALVKRIQADSSVAVADSVHQRYFDTYGTICYNLGQEYQNERRDIRNALKYYEQATRVPWDRRSLAALEAGKLLRNNVSKSVEYLDMALEEKDALSLEDQRELYRNLVRQHMRLGQRQEAVQYRATYRKLAKEARSQSE